MARLELVGTKTQTTCERDLFVLAASCSGDIASLLVLPSPYFACLLAWDATPITDAEVMALARSLREAGCVYICCWGPDCERVHDVFDRADLELMPNGPWAMSTWHSDQPMSEALWFVLFNAYPDDAYFDECRSTLGITIGSAEWASEVRSAFGDPSAFNARVIAETNGAA